MKYNFDVCAVECDAYELCALTQRNGSLGEYTPQSIPIELADGDMYYKIQSEAGAYYAPNVELSHTSCIDGIYFTLNANADGIIRYDGYCIVDKIKLVKGKGAYAPPDNMTLALLKTYCYLFCQRESCEFVFARVSYYNLDTKKLKYFNYKYTCDELKAFFDAMLGRIGYRVRAIAKQAQTRASLADARFPYGELREGQEIMIRESFSAMKHGRRIFVEAPTGTGKTISALFPAVRALGEGYCDKIFYLTPKASTRKEAFSAMSKLYSSGTALRTVIITAKEQICPCGLSGNNKRRLCSAEGCEYANRYYSRIDTALCEMLEGYTGYSSGLISQIAKKYKVCPYELSLDLSELCDVVICDYNYAFDPIVYFRRYFGVGAPRAKYTFLVDEAHNLLDRVRESYSVSLSYLDFYRVKKNIDPIDHSSVEGLFTFLDSCFGKLRKLCRDTLVKDERGERGFYISNATPQTFAKELEHFVIKANEFLFKNPLHYLAEEISELLFSVKKYLKIVELFDSNFRFYVSIEGGNITAKCYCLDPSELLDSLFLRAESAVLFSATLTPPEYFCSVLGGGKKARTVSLPSPFDPDRLCVAVADYVNTRFEDREDNAKRFATVIAATVKARAGNYIAYFPSYKCLEETYLAFAKKYPSVTTVVQKKNMTAGQRDEFLSAFKDDSGKLRIGFCVLGGAFSEGVDLPGSRLIGSIIFGVGLPALSNEKNIIREHYDSKSDEGIGYDYAYTYPGMNNVLQAAGRVIRTAEDIGVVVLADDRYATPKYSSLFPAHWQGVQYAGNASSLAEIMRRFWEKHS